MQHFSDDGEAPAIPIQPIAKERVPAWLEDQTDAVAAWVGAVEFKAKGGEICLVPGPGGDLEMVLVGLSDERELWDFGGLAKKLPSGRYVLSAMDDRQAATKAAIAWALGAYQYDRYRETPSIDAQLIWPEACGRAQVERAVSATTLVRDLINTPADDLGPSELADAAGDLAAAHGAKFSVIAGDDLIAAGYPAIYAVGRASDDAPRLIDMAWGKSELPKVTLVGKGVCFDTGGLDIKSATGMKLMKKDMGGAAHVLGLAKMIMMAEMPVRLRVLIPAVENNIAGNALRPLDVVNTRNGKTIEIGHTDAEGRVILADALSEAASETPEVLIDFATLTGAARVALGTDLPALFCTDDDFADALLASGRRVEDPLWRLPLWLGYRKQIDGKVADLTNAPEGGFGGAITAALFLQEFTGSATNWTHIDLMAWNTAARAGRPEGGEAMGMRAVFDVLSKRFRIDP